MILESHKLKWLGMCTTEAPWSLALGFVAPELTDTKVGLRDEGATCERTGQGRERQGRTPEQREAKADGGINQEQRRSLHLYW